MCIHPCIYQIAHTKTYVKYIYSVQCMCLIELCAGVSVCYCDKCKDLASLLTSIPHCMSICSSVSTATITYTGEGIHSVCDNVLAFIWQCSTPHSFCCCRIYTLYKYSGIPQMCIIHYVYGDWHKYTAGLAGCNGSECISGPSLQYLSSLPRFRFASLLMSISTSWMTPPTPADLRECPPHTHDVSKHVWWCVLSWEYSHLLHCVLGQNSGKLNYLLSLFIGAKAYIKNCQGRRVRLIRQISAGILEIAMIMRCILVTSRSCPQELS